MLSFVGIPVGDAGKISLSYDGFKMKTYDSDSSVKICKFPFKFVFSSEMVLKCYYESGALASETPMKDGKLEGVLKWYYEIGALQSETPWKDGKPEGASKWYYEIGVLQAEIPYKDGKREGVWRQYHENGDLKLEVIFVNGEPVEGWEMELRDKDGVKTWERAKRMNDDGLRKCVQGVATIRR